MHAVLVPGAAGAHGCLAAMPFSWRSSRGSALELVRFVPVAANPYIDSQGHRQYGRLRHVGP